MVTCPNVCVLAELICQVTALIAAWGNSEYAILMPNKYNVEIALSYVIILMMSCYLPGVPHLYGYMLKQRKSNFQKREKAMKKD